jgi:hypothetical protein
MPSKEHTHDTNRTAARRPSPKVDTSAPTPHPAAAVRRGRLDPGRLSPQDVLQLQHVIGNQAVGRVLTGRASVAHRAEGAVVQRALPDGATYQALDPTDHDLVAIGTAVASYNLIAGRRGSPAEFQTCFNRLQAVDRAIYRWFAQVSQHHQRLEGNPHAATIKTLMGLADREHEELIEASKTLVDVLPFDTTGLLSPELAQLKTLWQDMVNSRGKIKLVGSAGYNRRVLAELGKILSTPTGRALLTFLNTPKPTEVATSPQAALTNIYIGEKLSDLPTPVRTASPELGEKDYSEAQPLNVASSDPTRTLEALAGVKESDIDASHPPDVTQFPAVTATTMGRVREAVFGGLSGFTHGGKKYEFSGQGTGAFVTSFPGQAVHPGRAPGNEILTPGWVTLGHELGHAANMRAGAATKSKKAHFDDPLVTGLAGGAAAGKKWDDAEELLNIENIENRLRQESEQAEREGHQPPEWAKTLAVNTRRDLKVPLDALYRGNDSWAQNATYQALDRRCRTLPVKDVLDPGKVQALRDDVDAFLLAQANIKLPDYLGRISRDRPKATALLASLTTQPVKIQTFMFLDAHQRDFARIKKILHTEAHKGRLTEAERQTKRETTLQAIVNGTQPL